MTHFPLGGALSEAQLRLASTLPAKPSPVVLEGRYVRLTPFDRARDCEALHAISNGSPVSIGERSVDAYDADELIWRYLFKGPFETAQALGEFLADIAATANFRAFSVFDFATGQAVGFAAYTNNAPEHLKIELGHIWYSPVVQRTNANLEATYLMLRHAFELGYRRVEWKCDALNERSRRSALRMGFTFEGIQEAHFIIKGRNRDTAWFRMVHGEWPAVRRQLEGMLYGFGERQAVGRFETGHERGTGATSSGQR
jgi:RimJ/RimL family protein N-acetyltransferase